MKYVLDTNIVLYFLAGRLLDPLPDGAYHVSLITEMELLSYPKLTPEEKATLGGFLSALRVVGIEPQVKDLAVQMRRQHGLKLPDAIIAGTALALQAELVTNDDRLAKAPGLSTRRMLLK